MGAYPIICNHQGLVYRCGSEAGLQLYGVGIDVSSEEEDELNILSDVSLDESDYPLHNEVLLSALYFNQPTVSGVAAEQERNNLVSLQAGQKDIQTERKGVEEAGERSEQLAVDVDENEPSVPTKSEPFKVLSKLSEEQQSVTAASDLPSGTQEGNGPEQVSSVGSMTSDSSQRSKEKIESLTALSSYFVKGQSSLEAAIVSAIGLEKLTQLGRVGSARITVGSLQIEASFAKEVLTQQQENKRAGKTGSSIPLPIHSTKRYKLYQYRAFKSLGTKRALYQAWKQGHNTDMNICSQLVTSLAYMFMFFYSPTYFVEYQFPAVLHQQPGTGARAAGVVGRRKLPGSYELMRVASKKMKGGGMYLQIQCMY